MQRRDLLRMTGASAVVAAGSAVPAPWERLAAALRKPFAVDQVTAGILEARTADLFTREELLAARDLMPDLSAHGAALSRLAEAALDSSLQRRLVSVLGETEALIGWLLFDMGRFGAALKHYGAARRAAEDSGDGPLLACVLGYLSYLAEAQGEPDEARLTLIEAQRHVTGPGSAATRSWLAAREAETCAVVGDKEGTDRALATAFVAFDYATPQTERSWTRFFDASRLGSMALSSYAKLRHEALEPTAETILASLSAGQGKAKAIVYAELATASVAVENFERASQLVDRTLDVANTTSRMPRIAQQRLSRIADLVSGGPRNKHVRQLEEQLIGYGTGERVSLSTQDR